MSIYEQMNARRDERKAKAASRLKRIRRFERARKAKLVRDRLARIDSALAGLPEGASFELRRQVVREAS